MAYTLTQLITQVRRRADMTNSQFVTDSEITDYLNDSARELWDLLIGETQTFYNSISSLTTTAGIGLYSLTAPTLVGGDPPPYKIFRIDALLGGSGTDRYPLRRMQIGTEVLSSRPKAWIIGADISYSLGHGGAIGSGPGVIFQPLPDAAYSVQIHYAPLLIPLVLAASTFPAFGQWEEYIIVDAVKKCLLKENNPDVPIWEAQKAALVQRINNAATPADYANPEQIGDRNASRRWRYRDDVDFWWP